MKAKSKPFRVFEAGAGKHPFDLVKKAVRSVLGKKNREFIGVDYELMGYNLEVALRKAGVAKKPSNLKAYSGCAIRELEKLPAGSQNIIFAGLLVHQIILQNLSYKRGLEDAKRFFQAAKKALVPNGRLVLVQHLAEKDLLKRLASESGLVSYIREMTESEALRSESPFLRGIATSQGRVDTVLDAIKKARNQPEKAAEFEDLAKERGITSPYDLYKPIIMVLRKAKK